MAPNALPTQEDAAPLDFHGARALYRGPTPPERERGGTHVPPQVSELLCSQIRTAL